MELFLVIVLIGALLGVFYTLVVLRRKGAEDAELRQHEDALKPLEWTPDPKPLNSTKPKKKPGRKKKKV